MSQTKPLRLYQLVRGDVLLDQLGDPLVVEALPLVLTRTSIHPLHLSSAVVLDLRLIEQVPSPVLVVHAVLGYDLLLECVHILL